MRQSDWDAADDDYMRRERERLGGPPTPEEVVACLRGELPEAQAARVRALLVYYPELTSVLTEKAPPDAPPALTPAELARDRESLQARLAAPVVDLPKRSALRSTLPFAAVLIIGFVAGFLVRPPRSEEPRVYNVRHELYPIEPMRGPSEQRPHPLPANEENYLIVLMVEQELHGREYRVELVDLEAEPRRTVWQSKGLRPLDDATFEISVPRTFLRPSVYHIDLFEQGGGTRPIASYAIHVQR